MHEMTPAPCLGKVMASDEQVVEIPPGIYTIQPGEVWEIDRSGTESNPIVYRAAQPGTVRIQGWSSVIEPLVRVTGHHVRLEGLEITGRVEIAPGSALYRPQCLLVTGSEGVKVRDCKIGPIQGRDDALMESRPESERGRGDAAIVYSSNVHWQWGSVSAFHDARRDDDLELWGGDGISLRESDTRFQIDATTFYDAAHGAVNVAAASGNVIDARFYNRLGYGVGQWDPGDFLVVEDSRFFDSSIWNDGGWAIKVGNRPDIQIASNHVAPCFRALQVNAGDRTAGHAVDHLRVMDCEFHGQVQVGRFIEKDGSDSAQIRDASFNENLIRSLSLLGNGSLLDFVQHQQTHLGSVWESNRIEMPVHYNDKHTGTGYERILDVAELNDIAGFRRTREP